MTIAQRQLLAQLIIVAAVLAGAWIALLQPLQQQLAEFEQEAGAEPIGDDPVERAAALAAEAKRIRSGVQRMATPTPADDPAQLYGLVQSIARTNQVTLNALSPAKAPQGELDERVTSIRFTADVQGEFVAIASFAQQLGEIHPDAQVVSLYMTPGTKPEDTALRAQIEIEVLRARIPESLRRFSSNPSSPVGPTS